MKKKLIAALLALLLALSAAGCTKTPDEPSSPDNPNVSDDPNVQGEPGSPDTPDNPDNPDDTNNPNTPEDPDDPDGPNNPEGPGTQDDPGTSDVSLSQYLEDNGFFKGVSASGIVTLPAYKGITVPPEVLTPDAAAVQENVDYVLSQYGPYERLTDRAAETGDTVCIDFLGKMDGVAFEGGAGTRQIVTIGGEGYIEGFTEQIAGHTPGETFDIQVTFPDPYPNNPDFSGKPATFTMTLHYIRGAETELELNDEVAKEFGFESAAELKTFVEESVVDSQKDRFFQELLSKASCSEIPDTVVEAVQSIYWMSMSAEAAQYGVGPEILMAMMGYSTKAEYFAAVEENARTDALLFLAVQAIAEREGITVTTDDIAAAGYEAEAELYGQGYVSLVLLRADKVRSFVFDNAV